MITGDSSTLRINYIEGFNDKVDEVYDTLTTKLSELVWERFLDWYCTEHGVSW